MHELEMLLMFLPFVVGIGVGGPPPAKKPTEDSAAAVLMVLAASRGGFLNLPCSVLAWTENRMKEACDFVDKSHSGTLTIPSIGSIFPALRLFYGRTESRRVVLNPFLAEFFSQAILGRLAIRTAPVEIMTAAEACTAKHVIVKWVQPAGSLKYDPGLEERVMRGELAETLRRQPCLTSRIIDGAASVSYICKKYEKLMPLAWQDAVKHGNALAVEELMGTWATISEEFEKGFAQIIGKECKRAEKFYEGFSPNNLDKISEAVAWDGEQFLRIRAARVFLGCSAPHLSNVLCTEAGELISIDHCTTLTDDGESVRMLFKHTKRDTKAFDALRRVARLTEKDIQEAIAEVPRHPACGTPPDALERNLRAVRDYYVTRLGLWNKLLAEDDS